MNCSVCSIRCQGHQFIKRLVTQASMMVNLTVNQEHAHTNQTCQQFQFGLNHNVQEIVTVHTSTVGNILYV